jgi:signal transduction histidine kinase
MTSQAISQATVDNVRTTPRPPLTKRLKPVHWTVIDYAIGVVFGLIVFATVRTSVTTAQNGVITRFMQSSPGPLVGFVVAAVVTIAVATRRRHSMTSLCLLLGGSILVALLSGGALNALAFFAPAAYVLYLIVATFDNRRSAAQAIASVFLVMLMDAAIMMPHNGGTIIHSGGLILVAFAVGIAWSLGYIVRQRRNYAIGLQEEAASKAVAVERLRIARELHDVVAHSMSVIAVQAGYGQYVIDSQPADAKDALGAIQTTSREALEEMRRMLGALRYADETAAAPAVPVGEAELAAMFRAEAPSAPAVLQAGASATHGPSVTDGPSAADRSSVWAAARASAADGASAAAPLFPAPGLADLDRLIARTAGAGVRAEVHRLGTPLDLPPSIDLSAYRIIQEALTNVVKHAHASACSVLLDYSPDELTIEVTDSGAGVPALAFAMAGGAPPHGIPSGGHGIIGMRERVSLLGGDFTAGPLPGYGFQVSARIPLPKNEAR